MEGESGRNELLRGPFALFGVRGSAKLVRDLAKHRRTPMSPPQLIPPTSPGQIFAGDGRLRRRFSHTGHGPFRPLICEVLSSLAARCISQSGSVLRRLYLRPQPQTTTILPPGRKTHIHTPPPRPLAVPAASSPAYLKYFTPDSNIFISCSP